MKTSQWRGSKRAQDKVAFFQKAAADAFSPLTTAHGFAHVSTEIQLDWDKKEICTITYRGRAAEVLLLYYVNGNFVTCALSRLECSPDGPPKSVGGYGIEFLIKLRCPDREIEQPYEKNTNEDITRILCSYADVLREYGQDVLAGDPLIFGEMKRLIDEEWARTLDSGAVVMYTDETGTYVFGGEDETKPN